MPGIPPVIPSDTEDVAWALQTADALWKRTEHGDAIVWLRRAAQSAAEAQDDDRALLLAREAAELADWSAHDIPTMRPRRPVPEPNVIRDRGPLERDVARQTSPDLMVDIDEVAIDVSADLESERDLSDSLLVEDEPVTSELGISETPPSDREMSSVPTAAEKHAGILDPWADHEVGPVLRQSSRPPSSTTEFSRANGMSDDVVTSAGVASSAGRPPMNTPGAMGAAVAVARRLERPVDLSDIDAFADMPADVRDRFARTAQIRSVPSGEDVSDFLLAVVLEGCFDVSAIHVRPAARRVEKRGVVSARGTLVGRGTPMRLTAVRETGKVAIWSEIAAQETLRICPWVDDDLRASGDLLQAHVGLTMGPLGERLDPVLRAEVTSKLKLRVLLPQEILAARGKPVPGLFVVGAGELEIEGDDGNRAAKIGAGDFLFPHEVLRALPAPTTVRAAAAGALVLFADRGAAQELLVTCSPLLEIFAGM